MRAIILFTILILSQVIWVSFRGRYTSDVPPGDRDLRFTLQTVRCMDPLGYGDDDVRLELNVPGRDQVTFKKTMAHKGATKIWTLNEPFYFSEDSIVVLKLWIKGPQKRVDTIGIARIGKIEKNGACTTDIEFKGDGYRYKVKYSLEGSEALIKKSPTGTITSKTCGRIDS